MRIAIVDDDPIVCQSLETILTATGTADVLWSANDGGAAIRRYFESPENHPDILLIDIQMPGMNGLDAAREILTKDPAARILFLTTFSDQAYIEQAMRLGTKGYLIKQDVAAIAPALHAVMAGQVVLGADVIGKLTGPTAGAGYKGPDDASDTAGDGIPHGRRTSDGIDQLLNERERDIAALVAEGLDNRDIAAKLYLSEGTVRNRISAMLDKLALTNRTRGSTPTVRRFPVQRRGRDGEPLSAVLHDDVVDDIGDMLAIVGAQLQMHVHLVPGEDLQRVGAGGVQAAHRLYEQAVRVLLDLVDEEHLLAQGLRPLEPGQLADQLRHLPA